MKLKVFFSLVALAMCLAGSEAAIAQSRTPSEADLATMIARSRTPAEAELANEPTDALKHRLMGELETILSEDPASIRERQQLPVTPIVSYWTLPRPSQDRDVCASNQLELQFETSFGPQGTIVDPSKIWAVYLTSYYYFLQPPAGPRPPPADDRDGTTRARCAALHPGAPDHFIAAFNEDVAFTGVWLFNTTQAQVSAGPVSLPVTCHSNPGVDCAKQFIGLKLNQVRSISKCDPPTAGRLTCWQFVVSKPDNKVPVGDCGSRGVMCVVIPAGEDIVSIFVDAHSAPQKVTEDAIGITE